MRRNPDVEERRIKKLEKRASYQRNKQYYRKRYQENKEDYKERAKKRWASLTDEERVVVYASSRKRYKENPHEYIARVKKRYESLTPEQKEQILENQRVRRSAVKKKRRIISKGIQL